MMRPSIAAILIFKLLHGCADGALTTWDQNLVSLRKLRLEQAIKRIGNINLKMAALSMRLSHASLESAETHLTRRLRSLRWSVRGGSLKVTDTVASGISTGRSSWEASSK